MNFGARNLRGRIEAEGRRGDGRRVLFAALLAVVGLTASVAISSNSRAAAVSGKNIMDEAAKTAAAQLKALGARRSIDWEAGVMYAGFVEFSDASGDGAYGEDVERLGERLRWQLMYTPKSPFHADHFCMAQAFLDIYARTHDPAIQAGVKLRVDPLVDHLKATANDPADLTWSWCDTLFMAPPVLARMSALTGDRKYIDAMDGEFWKAATILYSRRYRLFYRDKSYFDKRAGNGKPVFWARGNGWVEAGLARVLMYMPEDYRDRAKYVALYREFSHSLAGLQGADGFWRSSLLDADQFPGPEASGTALMCSGMAWGINSGLLEKGEYLPVVRRAWLGLLAARRKDDQLGWVQRPAAAPGEATAEGTQLYGTGAFLLSAVEVGKLAPVDLSPANGAGASGAAATRPAS
jgi:rhamnogalacturonyl hydrolase YesR